MTDKQLIKIAKEVPMEAVLEDLGFQIFKAGRRSKTVCPFHSEKTASAVVGDRNVINCFGCGETADTIKLVMHVKGLDFKETVEYLNRLSSVASIPEKKVQVPASADENFKQALAKFRSIDNLKGRKVEPKVLNHLKDRGLINGIRHLKLNGYDIGVVDNNIAYKLNGFFIIRYPDNKANYGSPKFSAITVDKASKVLYVCEGITDALAVAEAGYNAVSLHSVENTDKFIARLQSSFKSKDFEYIIATDNDRAGLQAKEKLEAFFTQQNYNYKDCTLLRQSAYNDVGELYASEHKVML